MVDWFIGSSVATCSPEHFLVVITTSTCLGGVTPQNRIYVYYCLGAHTHPENVQSGGHLKRKEAARIGLDVGMGLRQLLIMVSLEVRTDTSENLRCGD